MNIQYLNLGGFGGECQRTLSESAVQPRDIGAANYPQGESRPLRNRYRSSVKVHTKEKQNE
jgi:hypothetical protein